MDNIDVKKFSLSDISSMVRFTEGDLYLTLNAKRMDDFCKIRMKDEDKEVKPGDYVLKLIDNGEKSYDVINDKVVMALRQTSSNLLDKLKGDNYKILRVEYTANKACPTIVIGYRLRSDGQNTNRKLSFEVNQTCDNAAKTLSDLLINLLGKVDNNE